MNLILKFFKIPISQKKLLIEAIFFLVTSKLVLMIFPFKICKHIFRKNEVLVKQASVQSIKDIKIAVERANKIAIWSNVCIVKSFAARFMLQNRGIASTIYLGVTLKNEKKLSAHAWLVSQGVYVTPRGDLSIKEIYSF